MHDVSRILENRILCELKRTLCSNRMVITLQSTAIVANLRQEVADATDTLNKQVEETTQRMTVEAAKVKNLNEMIRTLKDQNEEVHRAQCLRNSP